jgi:hypothetical protein
VLGGRDALGREADLGLADRVRGGLRPLQDALDDGLEAAVEVVEDRREDRAHLARELHGRGLRRVEHACELGARPLPRGPELLDRLQQLLDGLGVLHLGVDDDLRPLLGRPGAGERRLQRGRLLRTPDLERELLGEVRLLQRQLLREERLQAFELFGLGDLAVLLPLLEERLLGVDLVRARLELGSDVRLDELSALLAGAAAASVTLTACFWASSDSAPNFAMIRSL